MTEIVEAVNLHRLLDLPADEELKKGSIYLVKNTDVENTFSLYGVGNADEEGKHVLYRHYTPVTFIYETEEEFEEAKDSIPIGAIVIKLYE